MKLLYTFILDFKGGTYIKQIEAKSVYKAYRKWIKCISGEEYSAYFLSKEQNHFKTLLNITKDEITPIEETKNVWCSFFMYKQKEGLVNIVLTKESFECES